jgi:hypothetical protein
MKTCLTLSKHENLSTPNLESEQYCIQGKVKNVRCNEQSISSNTYKQWYAYRGFGKMMSL